MLHLASASPDTIYLQRLGQEVRRQRGLQSINRKVLAERSGVSERFLAQLEAGSGNISVVRLRHIALALDCPISALLPEGLPKVGDDGRKNRIALIGLRGAGKTTLGRLAADQLGVGFVELTERIEHRSGLELSDIFNLYGADGYRRLEQSELRMVIDEHDDCILAPAGGISQDSETFELLLTHFRTIWLTATPEDHMDRVIAQGDLRPMHGHGQALSELREILGTRARNYARADHTLDTSGRTVDQVKKELLDLIGAR